MGDVVPMLVPSRSCWNCAKFALLQGVSHCSLGGEVEPIDHEHYAIDCFDYQPF